MFNNPFPSAIQDKTYFITSPQDANYNCISWSIGSNDVVIWPDDDGIFGWPEDIDRNPTLENFKAFFNLVGFSECNGGSLILGWEKIAIYGKDQDTVLHASRQMSNGRWACKMGTGTDVEHIDEFTYVGSGYGRLLAYMQRQRGQPWKIPALHPPQSKILRP